MNETITLIAAKLELGPVQTLAHKEGDNWVLNDPPPNKALELAKCQRYQFNIYNGLRERFCAGIGNAVASDYVLIDIPLPTTLRAAPTFSYTGNWFAVPDTTRSWGSGAGSLPVISISPNTISNNFVTVRVTVEEAVVGERYRLVCTGSTSTPANLEAVFTSARGSGKLEAWKEKNESRTRAT